MARICYQPYRNEIVSLSLCQDSLLSRLFAVAVVGIFGVWFAVPDCHCQWEAIFGEKSSPEKPVKPVWTADSDTAPEPPCHCEDAPTKNFEANAESVSFPISKKPFGQASGYSLPAELLSLRLPMSRAPPDPEHLLYSEPRVYLRHHSFLL
jgi:hypothetical protein